MNGLMNWRFIKHPYFDYVLFEAKSPNGYHGYIITRIEETTAYIVDILTEHSDSMVRISLLLSVDNYLKEKGVVRVICRCINTRLESDLKKVGYIRTYFSNYFIYFSKCEKNLSFNRKIFITAADSDLDK